MNHRPAPSYRTPREAHAFTIIELVVAMAIASIMIFLVNRIFFDTTNAVSRGIGLSQIIGESRAFSSTLVTDTAGSVGPLFVQPGASGDRGFLFIGFKTYNNIDFANPRRLNGTAIPHDVQSDQLLAAIDITGQGRTPLTPRNDQTFSPFPSTAEHGLLWYGHVSRLNPDGSDGGELNAGNNRFGHQWIVGRQLMFLDDAVAGAAHIEGAYARSTLNTGGYGTVPVAPLTRWMGLSDILNINLEAITNSPASILGPTAPLSNVAYITHAARMAYVTERLRVASSPAVAPTLLESWNLAQTHAAFMSNCSDFQISFAGDFDGVAGSGIDIEDDYVGSGSVTNPEYRGGNIKWYGYPPNNPFVAGYNASKPSIYEPTLSIFSGINPGDPYFTIADNQIPDELAVQLGGSPTSEVDRAIVFKHDATDKATQWPHLIRIRYRLHDERGEIESTNGLNREQGIWFEQIIRVQ